MVREFLAVLVRAALQWALASLLLANGAAFCLIAAAASSLRLGPPCLLCARVHRLLCSDCGQEQQDAFRRLLCDAHLAAIARLGTAETEQRLQPACSPSDHVDTGTKYGGLESHRVVSIGSEICEQDRGGDDDQPRATNLSILGRTSSMDSGEGPYVSLFELAPLVALPEETPPDYDAKEAPHGHGHGHGTTRPEHRSASSSDAAGGEQALTVSGLVAALDAQRRELEAARAELHGERRARAELEEQGELDREAARVAMQLVHETETEKHELQRQLDAFRVRAQLHGHEAAALDAADYSAPASRLGRRPSRDGDSELMGLEVEEEASWSGNKNYQSLVDFLPGSVYSSSPDLANLLRLYTEGNGARRPKEGGITEEEEEEAVVVAVTAAAVSGFDGGDGEATSIATAAGSLPESGSDYVQADLVQDEAAVMRA